MFELPTTLEDVSPAWFQPLYRSLVAGGPAPTREEAWALRVTLLGALLRLVVNGSPSATRSGASSVLAAIAAVERCLLAGTPVPDRFRALCRLGFVTDNEVERSTG